MIKILILSLIRFVAFVSFILCATKFFMVDDIATKMEYGMVVIVIMIVFHGKD